MRVDQQPHLVHRTGKSSVLLNFVVVYSVVQAVLAIVFILLRDDPASGAGIPIAEAVGYLVAAVLLLAVAFGLARRRKWGLTLAKCVYLLVAVLGVMMLVSGAPQTIEWPITAVEVVLDVIALLYLFSRGAKRAFQ